MKRLGRDLDDGRSHLPGRHALSGSLGSGSVRCCALVGLPVA